MTSFKPKSDNTRICDDSKPLIASKKPLKLLPPLIHTPTIFCVNTEPTDLYMGSVAPGHRATALAKMPRTLDGGVPAFCVNTEPTCCSKRATNRERNRHVGPSLTQRVLLVVGGAWGPVVPFSIGQLTDSGETELEIFEHITEKLVSTYPEELETLCNKFANTPLKILTCCSGTKSPILGLTMVQKCMLASYEKKLVISHEASAEIKP
ncbi:hypothetical protein V8E51_019320 [Hyaloscypha variabilis]